MIIFIMILFALFLGIFLMILIQEYLPNRIHILLYHRLIEDSQFEKMIHGSEKIFTMPAKKFEEQMRFLKKNGYSFFYVHELLDILHGKKQAPPKPILITFDDGFQSVLRFANPVLKNEGVKATVFLTTQREAGFFEKYKSYDWPLTDEEVKVLHESGVSIQSHAHTHRPLVTLKEKEIAYEVQESKARIKSITGVDPAFIAIPGGFSNKRVERTLKDLGFAAICTSLAGGNSVKTSPFALRRLIVEGTYTIDDFAGGFRPLNIAMRRIISFLKRIPTKIIDPYKWLKIRKKIYDSRLGNHLTYSVLRKYLFVIVFVIILLFIVLAIKSAFAFQ